MFVARDLYRRKVRVTLDSGHTQDFDAHEARMLATALEEATGLTPNAERIDVLCKDVERLERSNAALRGALKRKRVRRG